jgi:hypothetical protein
VKGLCKIYGMHGAACSSIEQQRFRGLTGKTPPESYLRISNILKHSALPSEWRQNVIGGQ